MTSYRRSIVPLLAALVICLASCVENRSTWTPETEPRAARPSSRRYADELRYPARPHIFLIMVDTLRPDHLGCYGYARKTSPFADRLAERGVRFERFYSVSPWTNPAIVSLFTGRYPQSVLPPALHRRAIRQKLPAAVETLPELLQSAGYHTLAFVDHPGINPPLGHARGFEEFHRLYKEGGFDMWTRTDPDFVARVFTSSLADLPAKPVFLYLHLVYPHRPYIPAEPYAAMFGPGFERIRRTERKGMINRYDGEIRQTDDLIERLVGELERREMLDRTAVIFTSDHGEAFWEHGHSEHGLAFFDEEIRIPLILVPPGGRSDEPAVVGRASSNIDLFATLLDLAGLEPPAGNQGASLLRLLTGDGTGPDEGSWFFSESPHTGDVEGAAAIDGGARKYIRADDREMVFDLQADPREKRNFRRALDSLDGLRRLLDEHRRRTEALRREAGSTPTELDRDTLDRLRALGYVD